MRARSLGKPGNGLMRREGSSTARLSRADHSCLVVSFVSPPTLPRTEPHYLNEIFFFRSGFIRIRLSSKRCICRFPHGTVESLQALDYLHPLLRMSTARPRQPLVSVPWAAVVVERYVGPFAGLLPHLGGVLSRAGVQGGLAFKPPTLPSNRAGLPIADSAGP